MRPIVKYIIYASFIQKKTWCKENSKILYIAKFYLCFSTKMNPPSLLVLPGCSATELNISGLSDQDLMEALIDEASDNFKQIFQHPSGKFLPVCRWQGVHCSARREVTSINSFQCESVSKVQLAFLPPHLVEQAFPKGGNLGKKVVVFLPEVVFF